MSKQSFTEEVKFQVGQRVHVKERNVRGVITQVVARNAGSTARKIYYTVMVDDHYIKEEYGIYDGIPTILCTGDCLRAEQEGELRWK